MPLHAPEAVQAVVFDDDQVSVVLLPRVMVPGEALIDTAGAGLTVTVAVAFADPPGPVQLRV